MVVIISGDEVGDNVGALVGAYEGIGDTVGDAESETLLHVLSVDEVD